MYTQRILYDLSKSAIKYTDAKNKIINFLKIYSESGNNKMYPIGKNIGFDLNHIHDKLLSKSMWELYCWYKNIDLTGIILYLKWTGKIPNHVGDSLTDICKYFDIDTSQCHTAYGDAQMNLSLWKILINKDFKSWITSEYYTDKTFLNLMLK